MKKMLILGLLFSFNIMAQVVVDPNGVLSAADKFLGSQDFSNAFHLNDYRIMENSTCVADNCHSSYMLSQVVSAESTKVIIASINENDEEEFVELHKSVFDAAKGNMLRLLGKLAIHVGDKNQLTLQSSKPIKVDYLGQTREALLVSGVARICDTQCEDVPVTIELVKGVPMLAQVRNVSFDFKVANVFWNVALFTRE